MKHRLTSLLLSVAFLLASGCLAQRHKDDVLFPAITQAWPGVEADVQRGLDDAHLDQILDDAEFEAWRARVADLDQAIDAADSRATRSRWFGEPGAEQPMRQWAERGINDQLDDEEIGPGVAASLVERLDQFDAAITRLPLL